MNSDRNCESVTANRRKILATAASISLTAGVAGCQGADEDAEPTGTSSESATETPVNTETDTEPTMETQGTLQRDGADAMPASPISTHPRELTLEASDFGEGWEVVSSQTVLDEELIYEAVDEGEQATAQEVRLENTGRGAEALYGPAIYTDADAAAEVVTSLEQFVAESNIEDYSLDIGDRAVFYPLEGGARDGENLVAAVVQEQNATVGMSYFGPDDTDVEEWSETVRPIMESAHTSLADSY